jgi:hypothetical protein
MGDRDWTQFLFSIIEGKAPPLRIQIAKELLG